MTNNEVIAVDQTGRNAHQVFNGNGRIAWMSDVPGSRDKFLALFNTTDDATNVSVLTVELTLSPGVRIRDLWQQKDLGDVVGSFNCQLPPHGSGLYRVSLK
jgi:hypothetical protein